MPKLTISAINSNITVQDPFPAEGRFTLAVAAGHTEHNDLSFPQLQRIRPQLEAMEVAGAISYRVETTEKDIRAEEEGLPGLPVIGGMSKQALAVAGGESVSLYGVHLLGYQEKAIGLLGDPALVNGHLHITALVPGQDGDKIEVRTVDGAAEAIAILGTVITVTMNTGVSTWASLETLINAHPAASLMVVAAKDGTGLVVSTVGKTNLAGGMGAGVQIFFGGVACILTAVGDGQIDFDTVACGLIATDLAVLIIRINGHPLFVSVPCA